MKNAIPSMDRVDGLSRSGAPVGRRFSFVRPAPVAAAILLSGASPVWAAETGNPRPEGGAAEAALFYLLSGVALVSGLMICAGCNIVRMAVWLFGVLGSVAMLYLLLGAHFLAAIQFIVYAGGTLILLIFGVMLTNKSPWVRLDVKPREIFAAGAVGVVLFGLLAVMIAVTRWPEPSAATQGFVTAEIGKSLLTTYLVPFEVASVLLLVVMIGAAYMARQD